MAVPKKKSSRSRTGMRRYSAAYQLDPIAETTCEFTQQPIRSHTVSRKAIKDGLYQPRVKKAEAKTATGKTSSTRA